MNWLGLKKLQSLPSRLPVYVVSFKPKLFVAIILLEFILDIVYSAIFLHMNHRKLQHGKHDSIIYILQELSL